MKKKIIVFFVFLLIAVFVVDFYNNFSVMIAGKVQPTDYVIIKWGSSQSEVGIKGPYENSWYDGPATFDVDKEGNVYVVDYMNNRIIKVDKNSTVVDSIDISKITSKDDPNAKYSPIKLITTDKCMFLLYHYSFLDPTWTATYPAPPVIYSKYISIVTKDNIIKIDALKLLGYPVDVYMERLSGDRVVLAPSVPPEDLPTWKGPKAVIVNCNGETQSIKGLVNGSFDGSTPFATLIFDEDKENSSYLNTRIQVKDPKTNRVIFTSGLIDNGKPITYSLGLHFDGNKIAFIYQDANAYNKENNSITTHISTFTLFPRKEENYVMVVGNEDRENMLPPPFAYRVDFVLGQDSYFYRMVYMTDGLHIQRFEPAATTTEYFYRSHKL